MNTTESLKLIMAMLLLFLGCSAKFTYNITDSSKCYSKGGYWYNNKCWKDFSEEGISKSDIDSVVTAEMEIINGSKFMKGDKALPLVSFLPIEEKKRSILLAVYKEEEKYKSLIIFKEGKKGHFTKGLQKASIVHFDGDIISGEEDEKSKIEGSGTVEVIDMEEENAKIEGETGGAHFSFVTNESILEAGNSKLKIENNEAFLSGGLGTVTYHQISNLIKNYPKIKTIVMGHISGSVNDAINMHTGRILRENGFTTKVLSSSDIASGGVDLFCSGKERIVEQGAKIGIHSWCCENDLTAIEIPEDHPAHQYQIDYFTMALGKEKGKAFYFYTLKAAPFDSIHYMDDEDIKKWNIATKFINSSPTSNN